MTLSQSQEEERLKEKFFYKVGKERKKKGLTKKTICMGISERDCRRCNLHIGDINNLGNIVLVNRNCDVEI